MPTLEAPPAPAAPTAAAPARRRGPRFTPYLLLVPAVLVLLAGMGYPLYWQIITSMQEFGLAQQFGQPPTFVGLDNYARIFSDDRLWAVVARSILFCLVNAFLTVGVGVLLALLMKAVHPVVRIVLQVALLLAWAMPMVAAVTVWKWLFDWRTGVVNWLLVQVGFDQYSGHAWLAQPLSFFFVATVIIVWMSVPFVALSVYAALTQVSDEVLEAARIDGAGPARILWHITLPLIRPVIALVVVMSAIGSFQVFDLVLIGYGGNPIPEVRTIFFYIYQQSFAFFRMGYGSAIALVLAVILGALTAIQMRAMRANRSDLS